MEQQLKKPGSGKDNDNEELELKDLTSEVPESESILEKIESMQQEAEQTGYIDYGCGC